MARAPHGISALEKGPVSSRGHGRSRVRPALTVEGVEQQARSLAHDLASPLNVITMCASALLDRLPPDHPLREELKRILQAVDQATELTRQLYEFGRILRAQLRPVE
jgi:signal transduction histidine kinase